MTDREEFEAWMRTGELDLTPDLERDGDVYEDWDTQRAWRGWQAARATAEQPDAKPSTEQDWAKLDGAVAFHLIERHAEDWADAGLMMNAWRMARTAPEQSRDSVIEECCAAIKSKDDLAADDDYMLDSNDCIKVCRALKSQQDAAIESQSGGGS